MNKEQKEQDIEILLLIVKILNNPISSNFDILTLHQLTKCEEILRTRLGYK